MAGVGKGARTRRAGRSRCAKNLAEAVEMQSSYLRNQLDTLAAQAEEVRTLSTQVAADAAKPMRKGFLVGVEHDHIVGEGDWYELCCLLLQDGQFDWPCRS
jgi:hypothetical protein